MRAHSRYPTCVHVGMLSCFSCVWLLATLWTVTARLLCPWDSPGKNTGVGCHVLLQGIFLTQESNPRLLHRQAGSLPLVPPGKSIGTPTCTPNCPPSVWGFFVCLFVHFWVFGHSVQHAGSLFPDRVSELYSLQNPNHWTTRGLPMRH